MKSLSRALCLLAVFVAGCNQTIEIKDGRVPSELLPAARAWVGSYAGAVSETPIELSLSLQGDQPTLTANADFTGRAECHSKAGKLLRLIFREDKQTHSTTVAGLEFELDPGECWNSIDGRKLRLSADYSPNGSLHHLSYLITKDRLPHNCAPGPFPPNPDEGIPPQCPPSYIESGDLTPTHK